MLFHYLGRSTTMPNRRSNGIKKEDSVSRYVTIPQLFDALNEESKKRAPAPAAPAPAEAAPVAKPAA
jgi:hypothetical protein